MFVFSHKRLGSFGYRTDKWAATFIIALMVLVSFGPSHAVASDECRLDLNGDGKIGADDFYTEYNAHKWCVANSQRCAALFEIYPEFMVNFDLIRNLTIDSNDLWLIYQAVVQGDTCEDQNPITALPWGVAECTSEEHCVFEGESCHDCATSGCPVCDDCIGACLPIDPPCIFGGISYEPGDTFPADDGCNTCTCAAGGVVYCTDMACPQGCYYGGEYYQYGESFPALDGCNTCWCDDEYGVSCTEIACSSLEE